MTKPTKKKNLRASAPPCETTSTERKTLVPKLRFPEFRGTEMWECCTLKQVTTALLDGDWIESKDQSEDGYRLIQTGNVGVGEFIAKSGKARFVSIETFDRLRCTEIFPGDCLVSRLPDPAGRSCFIPDVGEKMITAVDCTIVRFDRTKIVPYLFIAQSQTDGYFRAVAALSSGSTRQRISRENLSGIALALPPSLSEQRKIAECLSSVDDLIAAQARKVDALKTHKKGLMQQLFPREGETQPRLRFTEFRRQGDWELRRLEELAKRGSGHTPSKSKPEYYNGGVKWISLSDSRRLDRGLITDTSIEISQQGIANSSAVIHAKGTVLISRDAGIGKIAVMGLPMAVSQHFIVWTCDSRLLSNWFLYYLLQYSKPIFERAATGSTIKTIGLQFFIDLSFQIPSLPEQQRIAACLSSLDELIMAEGQKLEGLKTHKRGLMQQLFPAPEQVEA